MDWWLFEELPHPWVLSNLNLSPQFESEEALLEHRREEHTEEMLSECSDCGKVYQRTEDLRQGCQKGMKFFILQR